MGSRLDLSLDIRFPICHFLFASLDSFRQDARFATKHTLTSQTDDRRYAVG